VLHAIKNERTEISTPHPNNIVVSLGINDRAKDPHLTRRSADLFFQNLANLFPNSQIYVATVSFSSNLPMDHQQNLQRLNVFLLDYFGEKLIQPLHASLFKVEDDLIHWTADTAVEFIDHWLDHID
jgi:hypothetical protein